MLSSQRSRTQFASLIASAVLAAATAWPLAAQVQSTPMRPVAPPPPPPASTPASAPDADNSGRPDDPAGPVSRDPGDLMNSGTMVYVDDSFASVDKLRNAIRQASQGQSQLAITTFQDIITNYGQKLVLLNDNSYVSITDYVRERLLAMPAVKSGMYDQLYGLEARRAVDDAIANRDVAGLIRVSDRYFPSSAAVKGLAQAADWYFERGEFSAAAQTWLKLLTHPQAGSRKAEFLFRAALAQHLAQDAIDATRLRDQLARDYADATGTVGGKEVPLLAALDDLLARPSWDKVALSGDEWPAFQGGPSRSQLLASNAAIGAKLWGMSISDSSEDLATGAGQNPELMARQQAMLRVRQGLPADSDASGLGSFPVLSNGQVFVHLGNQIVALSANSGARLWAFPTTVAPDPSVQQMIRNYGINPRLSGHDSASVLGDQVFAVLPPSAGGAVRYNNQGLPAITSRVVCLRRDDGTEIWSRTSAEIKLEKEGALSFIGSPLVTRQGVFVMARKSSDQNFTPQYLVRLDRDTGTPTWSCYLCSTINASYNSGLLAIGNTPVPTLVDDVLYICTGQGADCAIDANIGRILWLRVTASRANANPNGNFNGRRQLVMADDGSFASNLTSWKCNPPLILGDKMVATDSQNLRIYDRWTGRLFKTLKVTDLVDSRIVPGTPSIDVLAGAIGSKIVMSIRNASVCYDLTSLLTDHPQPEWVAAITDAGTAEGRPFLTTSGYYVPFTRKLVHIDVKTGKAEPWDWPANDKGESGKPGNLLVTSEQVIVVNDQEVSGYSKWEVARDNRLARIQAAPRDPAPYLDLAEISFRTNHQDLAQENMKQAVDLANGGAASASSAAGDMLARLYRTNLAFAELLRAKTDTDLRDQSRFYFAQCRAAARTPEQGAEWRMRLSQLSLQQKKYDEAAQLYSEVLADPALRNASYREPAGVQSASASAERSLNELIGIAGRDIYQRFEAQAAALTQRAAAARDAAALQQVVDAYPNSAASITAATTLAGICMDKQDWDAARRVLLWLEPRVSGPAQARAIADLATARLGLKKYRSAAAWAQRGDRQYKDFAWTDGGGGGKVTFADLQARIVKLGGAELDGRLPVIPKGADSKPAMELSPTSLQIAAGPAAQLLTPVEAAAALRQPNLIFYRSGNELHIRDAATNKDLGDPVRLPASTDAVLVGATRDTAILLQAGAAIGVDLKTHTAWTQTLKALSPGPARPPSNIARQQMIPNGMPVQVVNGNWVINGNNTLGPVDSMTLVDENGNIVLPGSASDPESVRRAAFTVLGNAARFNSARLLNGNLLILAGNQIDAFNMETGKPAWTAGGQTISAHLPNGTVNSFVGNEDLIVAEVDDPSGKGATFCSFDVETGRPAKTVKLEDDRILWRALGDDGTLYVVTDQAVAAYDMVSEQNHALWRRTDIGSRFAGAAALTLDGLVVVNDENAVLCLSQESGQNRWPEPKNNWPAAAQLKLDLLSNPAAASAVRSKIVGDQVVFQGGNGTVSFKSQPQILERASLDGRMQDYYSRYSPQEAWESVKLTDAPPRQSMLNSSTYLVELSMGAVESRTVRTDRFTFTEIESGALKTNVPVALPGGNQNEGPLIRSWQIVDGGIVFETIPSGLPQNVPNAPSTIYFWRARQNP